MNALSSNERLKLKNEYKEAVKWFMFAGKRVHNHRENAEKFQAVVRFVNVLKNEINMKK